MKIFSVCIFCLLLTPGHSQLTSADEVMHALDLKQKMHETSLVKNLLFKNIGPTVMSGRVVDLEINPDDPTEFYVAYASGGLWYTNNNGTSFNPVMDNTPTQNLGDIAVHWPSGQIWAGTGESNASRSSYAGIGILKSVDRGQTWTNMGLADSHHIGRILINPDNPDEIIVGVTGHLYSPNKERGIYRSEDGGNTWQNSLFINEQTGIIDLTSVPGDFKTMYAAAWEKDRKYWHFRGSGPASGIYKSTDAGKNWSLITNADSGFPQGKGVGRIGLAVFDENTIYAVHDSQFRREKQEKEVSGVLTKIMLKDMNREDFLKLSNAELNTFLKENRFPEKYTSTLVKAMVEKEEIGPQALSDYLDDANRILFETPVIGAEIYRTHNQGLSWTKMNTDYINDFYYSYGYYFGQIAVDPSNKDKIYIGGVPILKSDDGGKNFKDISADNVHADHHAIWVNPNKSGHLINGNDGGVNISYDDGQNWSKNNAPAVGQFYSINVDYQEPYNVYGGLQDNGVWMGPHDAVESTEWQQTGHYTWKRIMNGDGMQTQIDKTNPNVVYTGFQFGNYYRLDMVGEFQEKIQPQHELGEPRLKFNWQTPILISPHNQDILYLGSNKLHRSMNQGRVWETISGDLSHGGREGNVANGTITTISESPFEFGLLYVGTDDGQLQMSENSGASWNHISETLPGSLWVTEVVASRHDEERVYACLNGYRNDDFETYIFTSDDRGASWKNIAGNIPDSPVNALVEDPKNPQLIFAATDNGLYTSFNRGTSWELLQNGIPNVAIHDLVIQDKANDLLVGTHGRSIYKLNIEMLQELSQEVLDGDLFVFDLKDTKYSKKWGNAASTWSKPDTPGLEIGFYSSGEGVYGLSVLTPDGIEVSKAELEAVAGINIASYDMAFSKQGKKEYLKKYKMKLRTAKDGKTYLPAGNYRVRIQGMGNNMEKDFEIIK